MGQIPGCPPFIRSRAGPSGKAPSARPLLQRDSRLGWAGVTRGRARAAGGISRHAPSPSPGEQPPSRDAARAAPGPAGAGRDAKNEDGGTREGRGCSGGARGKGAQGAGSCAGPRGGRAAAGAQSQTGRRAGRARAAAGGLRRPLRAHPGGCPTLPSQSCPLSKRPQLSSRGPAAWEEPPADKACVYAASAPGTGVARRRAGRGLRGRDGSAAALPTRRPGSDDRAEACKNDPCTPPLSCPSF